jgi:hypothetical protein
MSIVSICDWLENKSQGLVDQINTLIDLSDNHHMNGNIQSAELIDNKIDSLYIQMNGFDDRLSRILTKGYKKNEE